jgi:L-alanine-DL-glutamate epimerase-like enolase superfamily enzyme
MQASLRPATSNRMLVIDSETVLLKKKVPLTITRGTRAESRLLWVRVCSEGVEGWGEAGEFSVGPLRQDLAELETQAQRVASMLAKEDPFDRAAMEQVMLRAHVSFSAAGGGGPSLVGLEREASWPAGLASAGAFFLRSCPDLRYDRNL